MDDKRLKLAYDGKTYKDGGLNVTHLKQYLKDNGLKTNGTRCKLLLRIINSNVYNNRS